MEPPLDEYLKHISLERGLAANTCKAYASDLKQFLSHLKGRGREALAVSHDDLSDYLWELKEKGLEASTLFRKTEALKSFYAFQASERRIKANPAEPFRASRRPERLPRTLTEDEISRLLGVPPDGSYEL